MSRADQETVQNVERKESDAMAQKDPRAAAQDSGSLRPPDIQRSTHELTEQQKEAIEKLIADGYAIWTGKTTLKELNAGKKKEAEAQNQSKGTKPTLAERLDAGRAKAEAHNAARNSSGAPRRTKDGAER